MAILKKIICYYKLALTLILFAMSTSTNIRTTATRKKIVNYHQIRNQGT